MSAPFDHPRGNYIDGQWHEPVGGGRVEVENPATGDVFTTVPDSPTSEVDLAVAAARRSFDAGLWRDLDPSARGRVLWELSRLVEERLEDLAQTEMRDSGKPIAEARGDIEGVIDTLQYFAGLSSKVLGQTMPLPEGQLGIVVREPIGVVGAITPWNFPLYVAVWKVAAALCVGNSVVLKPSELAPLTCLAFGELATAAGVPNGVLNVVTGVGPIAGAHLAAHPDVDLLVFTGSTATGESVMRARAHGVRPLQVELGGKSPHVDFPDADLAAAVAAVAAGAFYAQGENCNAGSRLLVHASIHDDVVDRLVRFAEGIRLLPPEDESSQLGALISAGQLARVEGFVGRAEAEGACVATGGARPTGQQFGGGYFYRPTVLLQVNESMEVFQEEVFGPVITVTSFRDDDEAVRLANATRYGLAAGVWTSDITRALRCARQIKSGYVWVNTYNSTPVEAPFGGVKSSGFGRDTGLQAIDHYLTWKTIGVALNGYRDWYGQVPALGEGDEGAQ